MSPARPVDVNYNQPLTSMNPHRITEHDRATIAGVDKDKLDKMAAQMVSLNKMDPAIVNFLKLSGEKLNLMCTRDFEKDIKALPAQPDDPSKFKADWFDSRDTSRGVAGQDYLPGFILSDPDEAHRAGYFTKEQSQALKFLANTHSDPNFLAQQKDNLLAQDPNAGKGERGFQQGGGQQQNQGDDAEEQHSGSSRQAISGPPAPSQGNSGASNRSPGAPNLMARDEGMMNSMFPQGDPYADFLRGLFPLENQSRTVFLDVMQRVQYRRQLKQNIMAALSKLDPSKPQDAAKLYKLQNQMQTVNMDDQMDLDALGQVRAEANTMKDLRRSLIETLMQDRKTLAQNIGVK